MMTKLIERWAKSAFLAGLDRLEGGTLRLVCPERTFTFRGARGPVGGHDLLEATMFVMDQRFFSRALAGGDIGIGEAYMDGDWTTPDLVGLARLMLRNMRLVDSQGGGARFVSGFVGRIARRLRTNTIAGSRANVRRHYDLGNDFFRLFLDDRLVYSCACYEQPDDTLERAQQQKLDRICRKLDLGPSDHVLEIGTGWGGFAEWAASRYGCRVTTTTISEEQFRYARDRAAQLGEASSRIDVRKQDYRELSGRFDKIVSIEMFEAVGLKHYDTFFAAVDRLLAPDGAMLLQTITLDEQWFPVYQGQPDWIEKYIFPGGELASVGEILRSLARVTRLSVYHAENIGTHYARTLHAWRKRFHDHLDRVRALGFDERFIRMWDLYLAYCEAAFLERHAGNFQLLLTKNYSAATFFNEPWSGVEAGALASAVA